MPRTGTLVPPDDPAALAAALGRYLDDPEVAVAHGLGGRARVLRDHAPEVHLRRVANLYSDVRIAHAAGSAA
jgi:glycosyltransferase involved in cell wall biosynthesis